MFRGGRRAVLAIALLEGGCANRPLTRRTHEAAGPCAVRDNGAEITCAGLPFASLTCDTAYDGCKRLVLRYADGDAALLYESPADPKFYRADHVTIAADGSRIWFLEAKGLFSPEQTWHVYDVRSGVLGRLSRSAPGYVDVPVRLALLALALALGWLAVRIRPRADHSTAAGLLRGSAGAVLGLNVAYLLFIAATAPIAW